MDFFECLVSIKKPRKKELEEALLFMECQQIIAKSCLFLKSCMTRDNAGCSGLCRPARFCTSSGSSPATYSYPWKRPGLGVFLHLPKLPLLLTLARTWWMEASDTAQLPKGVLRHSGIAVWRYWSWHLTDITRALGPVLILFGHCKVTAWSGWNQQPLASTSNFIKAGHFLSLTASK